MSRKKSYSSCMGSFDALDTIAFMIFNGLNLFIK